MIKLQTKPTTDNSLINQVFTLPDSLSTNHPVSIKLLKEYAEQQVKIKKIAKRLTVLTSRGEQLAASEDFNDQIEFRKLQLQLEKFVEAYLENDKVDADNLKDYRKLIFARFVNTCEEYYAGSIVDIDNTQIEELKSKVEEYKKDLDKINCLLK